MVERKENVDPIDGTLDDLEGWIGEEIEIDRSYIRNKGHSVEVEFYVGNRVIVTERYLYWWTDYSGDLRPVDDEDSDALECRCDRKDQRIEEVERYRESDKLMCAVHQCRVCERFCTDVFEFEANKYHEDNIEKIDWNDDEEEPYEFDPPPEPHPDDSSITDF